MSGSTVLETLSVSSTKLIMDSSSWLIDFLYFETEQK
ncbi:MAG: hypothetical protein TECD_00206 [Hyphomicrobiaceae bacterium hypho_1]